MPLVYAAPLRAAAPPIETPALIAAVRELGWPYLEKLAEQQVLQIQSATDTPKKIVLGERPVMADGIPTYCC